LAVADWRLRRWRLWFLALSMPPNFFVASTNHFAAETKRLVDRTEHFVVVIKYFCYPYFNKIFCWYDKTFYTVCECGRLDSSLPLFYLFSVSQPERAQGTKSKLSQTQGHQA